MNGLKQRSEARTISMTNVIALQDTIRALIKCPLVYESYVTGGSAKYTSGKINETL